MTVKNMEIILWIIGIVLGIFLLKFIYCFNLQLIGPGLALGFFSFIICAVLVLFDAIKWETCFVVVKWAFYIGSGIGVILFLCHPIDTLSRAFDLFDDDTSSSSSRSSSSDDWKERYSFYDENGHYTEVESSTKYNSYDFEDSTNPGEKWERTPQGEFRRKY